LIIGLFDMCERWERLDQTQVVSISPSFPARSGAMKRVTLLIAVLVALACTVNTASAAVGTPGSLAANVASAAVGHYPRAVVRVVTPAYRPWIVGPAPVVVRPPLVVPAPVIYPRPVYHGPAYYGPAYYGPVYRPIVGGAIGIVTPGVSVGIGY
jgi:hypothetical protein